MSRKLVGLVLQEPRFPQRLEDPTPADSNSEKMRAEITSCSRVLLSPKTLEICSSAKIINRSDMAAVD